MCSLTTAECDLLPFECAGVCCRRCALVLRMCVGTSSGTCRICSLATVECVLLLFGCVGASSSVSVKCVLLLQSNIRLQ